MKIKLALLFLAISFTAYCQNQDVPIGQWKDYLSYQNGLTVCQGGGNIYCCCSSGVFSLNLSDNSITKYNRVNGLSDIGCSVARYNSLTNTLVVGYSDGNIDLVTPTQTFNLPALKNSLSPGGKTINNIYFSNNLAYIGCGQGVMVVDLYLDIIVQLYDIGPESSALNVNDITIYNDTAIFAATEKGVYSANLNSNLNDFHNWKVVSQRLPSGLYNSIITCGTKMYASYAKHISNNTYAQDTIFVYNLNPGKWSLDTSGYQEPNGHHDTNGIRDNVYSMQSATINNVAYFVYTGAYNISVLDSIGNRVSQIANYGFSSNVNAIDALLDNNMNIWMADENYGLVESSANNTGQNYYPPGPFSNSIFDLATNGTSLYIAPGGYNQGYVPSGLPNLAVSDYTGGSWYKLVDQQDTLRDLCCLSFDPKNPTHACAGSFGHGIVEFNNNAISNVYNPSNTNNALSTLYDPSDPGYYSVRIGGVGFDSNSNLWATNSSAYSNYLAVKHA
ncbi:MAG TPA: hypothetical protein VK808_04855, partial [Bacteroidia bacterium]|nr:hypothetical protein [Bacteroidia bacterium]